MRRRDFIRIVAAGFAGWPLVARAQQSTIPVIGFVNSRSAEDTTHLVASFRSGLAEHGYVEG
jgi:nucleoside-diphosphate-sugar epimerase